MIPLRCACQYGSGSTARGMNNPHNGTGIDFV